VPVAVYWPDASALLRALSCVIWNTAPLTDILPFRRSTLPPASHDLLVSGGSGAVVPVVLVSCSSDGSNDVL
jgi:hypothetical protein